MFLLETQDDDQKGDSQYLAAVVVAVVDAVGEGEVWREERGRKGGGEDKGNRVAAEWQGTHDGEDRR